MDLSKHGLIQTWVYQNMDLSKHGFIQKWIENFKLQINYFNKGLSIA
jgi:hypothetical protein